MNMAIFGTKQQKKNKKEETDSSVRPQKNVIRRPRISEKSVLANDRNVYTYEVESSATKQTVRDHIVSTYGKIPLKITMSSLPAKKRARRSKPAVKKAHITLRKGDTIEFLS